MKKFNILNTKLAKKIEENLLAKVDNEKATKEFNKKMSSFEGSEVADKHKEAILFAQCVELQFLKSPSQAVFPDFSEFSVEEKEDAFVVTGYVDSPNSYGALTRGKVHIYLSNIDGKWKYKVAPSEVQNLVYTILGIAGFCIIGLLVLVIL